MRVMNQLIVLNCFSVLCLGAQAPINQVIPSVAPATEVLKPAVVVPAPTVAIPEKPVETPAAAPVAPIAPAPEKPGEAPAAVPAPVAEKPAEMPAVVPPAPVVLAPEKPAEMPVVAPVVPIAPASEVSVAAPATPVASVPEKPVEMPVEAPVAPMVPATPEKPAEVPAAAPVEAIPALPAAPAPEKPAEVPSPSVVPSVPVPPQEVAAQEPKPEEVAPEDFDTSKLKEYGGNWYFKQGWWQRAEREYEKSRQVIDQIFESRMEFFERQSSLNRNLFDPFYMEIGFERGELQDVIDLLMDKIEEERKNEGMLDIKEREFLAKLEEEKEALEQLKLNSELVNKYDTAISNAINELLKQLNQARQYEQVAWQEFKAIAEDLNDVVARARFYAVKTQHKNIKNIFEYLKGSFKEYFDRLEDNAKKEIDLVKESIKTLKARGLDLKEQAKLLVEEEKAAKKQAPEPAKEETTQPGFLMRIFGGIGRFFKAIWNVLLGWIYRF